MIHPLSGGHRQIFDAQATGLSGAWRRAAEADARSPRPARHGRQTARRMCVGLGAAAFLAAVMAIAVMFSAPLSKWALELRMIGAPATAAMASETLGWTAAALMVATFSCCDPMWMRPLAVCTNLAFAGYACFAGLAPVLVLHSLLLPINLLRWWQSARTSTLANNDGATFNLSTLPNATRGSKD